jgi:DNA-binding transcriptional LysR family regulator
MGRAALRLAMAQPPLSQSIGRLEKELGVKLFERANRRLTLTRAGAAFVEEARASVLHADAALHVARAAHDGEAGEIRIGFVSAALYEHLPHLLSRLREKYPDIHPKLIEVSTNEQIAALSRSEIDIGFVHPPLGTDERLDVHGYPAEDLIAVLPDDRRTHGVTLTDIARHGLIIFPAAQGPALHARIMDTFTKAGLEVRIVQEATRALTMLPRSTQRLVFQGVRYAGIADVSLPAWPLAVIAKRRPRPAIVDSVWKLLEARPDVS